MQKSNNQQTIVRLREKRNPPISEEEALQKARDNFMKALTECLILARLSKGDRYGYEISQSIKAYSRGCFHIPEGAMDPTLYRMLSRDISRTIPPMAKSGSSAFITRSRPPAVNISKRSWPPMGKPARAINPSSPQRSRKKGSRIPAAAFLSIKVMPKPSQLFYNGLFPKGFHAKRKDAHGTTDLCRGYPKDMTLRLTALRYPSNSPYPLPRSACSP